MLARPVEALPDRGALPGGCAYEPKLDGYRALLFVNQDGCRVQSRRGHDISDAFDDVAEAASNLLPPGLVLDGELVVWGDEGGLSFTDLQRRGGRGARLVPGRRRPASFIAFDVLEVADVDVREQPLSARRQLLEAALAHSEDPGGSGTGGGGTVVQLVPQTTDPGVARQWLSDYAAARVGVEGVVVKGLSTPYRGGTRGWQKHRVRDTVEAVVGAVAGPVSDPDHLVLGQYDDEGALQMVGTTTALDRARRTELGALLARATVPADHPWTATDGRPGGGWSRGPRRPVHLVEPAVVVEVSVDGSTDRGRWRHPVRVVRVRTDLLPDEVRTTAADTRPPSAGSHPSVDPGP